MSQDYKMNLLDNTIGYSIIKVEKVVNDARSHFAIESTDNPEAAFMFVESMANISEPMVSREAARLCEVAGQTVRKFIQSNLYPPSQPDPTVELNARIKELEIKVSNKGAAVESYAKSLHEMTVKNADLQRQVRSLRAKLGRKNK